MDRRDTIKTLLAGAVAGTLAGSTVIQGCHPDTPGTENSADDTLYGRTPEELVRDQKLMGQKFLTDEELTTIAILCDIIMPATGGAGSATDAGVPEFIEFIAKDIESHQLPLRGGIMWLNAESLKRFNLQFNDCSEADRIDIIDDIAYPDKAQASMSHGVKFFNLMRDLTLTGYYTSRMGFKDLGYKGNIPTIWDGVPEDVLRQHNLEYDPEWIAKCINQDTRNEIARWDDEGNLLS